MDKNTSTGATGTNISLTGFIGSINSKEKEGGKITTFLRIATHRRIYNKEDKEDKTDWHNAVAYGNIAKVIKDFSKKGDSIIINGELENWEFEDEEGIISEKSYIKINKMEFKSDCYATLFGVIGNIYRENDESPVYIKLSNKRKVPNKEGEYEEKIDWHTIMINGKLAEIMQEHARNGQKILVNGALEVSEEKNENNEYNIEKNYIRAYNVKFL